jgi:hypothetical protein
MKLKNVNRFEGLLSQVGVRGEEPTSVDTSLAPAPPETPIAPLSGIGKRSNPSYKQISTYVPAKLYREVKKQLVSEERTLSDVIEELLRKWVVSDNTLERGLDDRRKA